jgi:glycosyltransferase involved in cell wall biosynthesis
MEIERTLIKKPFFSICIPQHNRTSFLLKACESLLVQTFKDFELCISDDCSTDGREDELLGFLEQSHLSFVYRKQEQNQRYDGNLRTSITLAKGKVCFLLGNDDCLALPTTLEDIYAEMQKFAPVGVVITNYADFSTGKQFKRIKKTGIIGRGPQVAVNNFRNFSFVSGIILDTAKAKEHATDRWDGSEMYQMFIGCRILAEGYSLLGSDRVAIRKDIQLPGEQVDSYARRPRLHPCPIVERHIPLVDMGKLVADAVEPYTAPSERQKIVERILRQLLSFPYGYWIVEYRRVQSWKYAIGIALGMRLKNIARGLTLNPLCRLRLRLVYWTVTLLSLIVPITLFRSLYPLLYSLSKSRYSALSVRSTRQ